MSDMVGNPEDRFSCVKAHNTNALMMFEDLSTKECKEKLRYIVFCTIKGEGQHVYGM